jgi:ribosome modulation factor
MNRTEYEQVSPEVILRTTLWGGSENLRQSRRRAYHDGYETGLTSRLPLRSPTAVLRYRVDQQEHWLDGWRDGKEAKRS